MSINHLIDFIGENLNIGATKFKATDYIVYNETPLSLKQGVGIKSDEQLLTTSRKIVWGEVLDYLSPTSGNINNCINYNWNTGVIGRCIITLLETGANLNANGTPLILANCSAILPPSAPLNGGRVTCCKVISPTQIQVETCRDVPIGVPFMLCVVY